MGRYRLAGLPEQLAEEVRTTGNSPRYGHPVLREVAGGTGPCRSCLGLFEVGVEERLLFTHQPDMGAHAVGAPGPVFIHANACGRYEGTELPRGLTELPLIVEGRTLNGRTLSARPTPGHEADQVIREVLDRGEIDFVTLRHGSAGCFIARVDRA